MAPAEGRRSEVNGMTSWAAYTPGRSAGRIIMKSIPKAAVSRPLPKRKRGSLRRDSSEVGVPPQAAYSPFLTSILRAAGFSGSLRGISMLNTPSLWVAVIPSISASSGRDRTRRNEP